MKSSKKVSHSKGATAAQAAVVSESTEFTLVRLLQDDQKWESDPLENVEKLLNLLEVIDREDSDKFSQKFSKKGGKDTEIESSLRDEAARLSRLHDWLSNHSSISQSQQRNDLQFSCGETETGGLNSDFKGNR
jgi:TPP-dependent pyruvate/acetoin dehydrogenase alpha subunit